MNIAPRAEPAAITMSAMTWNPPDDRLDRPSIGEKTLQLLFEFVKFCKFPWVKCGEESLPAVEPEARRSVRSRLSPAKAPVTTRVPPTDYFRVRVIRPESYMDRGCGDYRQIFKIGFGWTSSDAAAAERPQTLHKWRTG